MRNSLKKKINLSILVSFLIITFAFSMVLVPLEMSRHQTMVQQIKLLLKTLVDHKKVDLANELFAKHERALKFTLKSFAEFQGITASHVYLPDGSLFVFEGDLATKNTHEDFRIAPELVCGTKAAFEDISSNGVSYLSYHFPLFVAGDCFGSVKVFYAMQTIQKQRELNLFTFVGLMVTLLMLMTLVLNLMLNRQVLNPVIQLKNTMQRVRQGELDERPDIHSQDEIGELANSFAIMTNRLKESFENLEGKVRQRTSELNHALTEVQVANHQIMESLDYAGKIQQTLLPQPSVLNQALPAHFVLWLPRDVVGGDVYAVVPVPQGVIVAVADCTGHGVPGALVSMVAASALNRCIRDELIYEPHLILRRMNFLVKDGLGQNNKQTNTDDGMDIALCWIDYGKKQLHYSGATLPLVVVNKDGLRFIRGDRQSIGYQESLRSRLSFDFTPHTLPLSDDMSIYLFSDGFQDQPGGVKGIGLGRRRLLRLIEKAVKEPMERQRNLFLEEFEEYRGQSPRRDDVTLLGFRVIEPQA